MIYQLYIIYLFCISSVFSLPTQRWRMNSIKDPGGVVEVTADVDGFREAFRRVQKNHGLGWVGGGGGKTKEISMKNTGVRG